ncbi:MAG: hypothetical protein HY718_10480 [Planctomycetes bacterium]|nr:hypothetical protein [Planctomycetota bacterium]
MMPVVVFAMLPLGGCVSPPSSAWIGLNTGVGGAGRATATRPANGDLPRTFQLVAELKAPLVREAIMNWGLIQPRPGRPYDFAFSDEYVRSAQQANADVLAVFQGIPAWASVTPNLGNVDPGLPPRQHAQAFAAFVEAFVERYDADGLADMVSLTRPVRAYQFMCEMEDVDVREYAYWLKLFYQAVKKADRRAVVVLGALRSPGVKTFDQPAGDYPSYFEHLLADPELAGPAYPYFDVAAFNSFPVRYPGRSPFDDAVAYLRQTMADHRLSLPIWLTALGCAGKGAKEGELADNLVKWVVKARTIGIERAYWHSLRDADGAGPPALQSCGLVRGADEAQPMTPRAGFHALRTMIDETRQRPHVAMRGDGLYVLTGRDEPRYVIWRPESHDPSPVLLSGWWSVETLAGTRTVEQGAKLKLTGSPLFLQRTTSPFIR